MKPTITDDQAKQLTQLQSQLRLSDDTMLAVIEDLINDVFSFSELKQMLEKTYNTVNTKI